MADNNNFPSPMDNMEEDMMKTLISVFSLPALLLATTLAQADVNPDSGGSSHHHAEKASGKLITYRVQTEGMEFGSGSERLDAEVLVRLDSAPQKIFGVRLHQGSSPATIAMVETLKEAYLRGLPVTLFHVQPPDRKNVNILWVELNR